MSRFLDSAHLRVFDPEARASDPSRRQLLVAGTSALAASALTRPPAQPPGMLFETAEDLSPEMTLTQFFAEWFLPVVLVGKVEASHNTINLYRDALDWWRIITRDPPVCRITDRLLADFKVQLLESKFRRGRIGRETKLSRATISKHLKALRAIIYRLGPSLDPLRPTSGLLTRAPLVPGVNVKYPLKPCYTLQEARAIASAAASFGLPRMPDLPAPVFWRRVLGAWYFTGLRSGTVAKLTRGCIALRDNRLWLDVPEEAVTKTDKGLKLWLHPDLAAAFELDAPPETRLIPKVIHHRYLIDLHQQIQAKAGLPPERQLSPHAWRRTHAEQMKLLGMEAVGEIVRLSLDHADVETSTTHYTSIVNELRLRLPPLWPDEGGSLQVG